MNDSPLGLIKVRVIALAVKDLERANKFYGETLGLAASSGKKDPAGWLLGGTILMMKENWLAPTAEPNPRFTIAVESAPAVEQALRARGVTISDAVQTYGEFHIGSCLDSEGNKLWFCSPV